jgi:GLPGLI family protein
MKKMSEKTFTLYFDKNASIYEEEVKLDAPNSGGGGMRMMSSFSGAGGKMYKNIKDKVYTMGKEMMGKEFLIKDTLTNFKWKMTSETKKIGNYTCFKATTERPASKSDFRNLRMSSTEAKSDKKDGKDKSKTSSNILGNMDLPKTIAIEAWYTPEIPINQGPEGYWGLPGLILEVTAGKTIILSSKVAMNIKDKVEIKASTAGEVVTQSKYDDIVVKKMEEMRDMWQNNRGQQGGGSFRIR